MTQRRVTVVASEILGATGRGTGGPGTADSLLAVALGVHGHRVELLVAPGQDLGQLSPAWERIYESAHVRVRALDGALRVRPSFLQATTEVFQALRTDPPDVVVADDWRGLAYTTLRARQLGLALADTAVVVYSHGPARVLAEAARKVPDTLDRFGEEIAQRSCIELADVVVSPSEWLLGWMRRHDWHVPASARVLQNLWESAALGTAAARVSTGAPLRRLVFFGQLREGKGIRIFIESLQRVQPSLLQGVELLFLGRETPRWTEDRIRAALGTDVSQQLSSLRFETGLDRSAALQELLLPQTLVVIPSLLENSPYAVAECIEHGIPFIAADTGGVPELVAEPDRSRVLCPPTADDFAVAVTRALSSPAAFAPAAPAREPAESLAGWLELIESVAPSRPEPAPAATRVSVIARGDEALRRARRLAEQARSVEVDVVSAESRRAGLERVDADWVVFLDDEDTPDDGILDAFVAAQAAANADVVTAAVRPADDPRAAQLFLGDPGALGLVENQYGVLGMVRRSAVAHLTHDGGIDPDWPLFARLALAGARVVSIPDTLSEHRGRPGTVGDVPGDGLAVLAAFEEREAGPLRDLPELAATLGASLAGVELRRPADNASAGALERILRILRSEGVAGVARRARRRAAGGVE